MFVQIGSSRRMGEPDDNNTIQPSCQRWWCWNLHSSRRSGDRWSGGTATRPVTPRPWTCASGWGWCVVADEAAVFVVSGLNIQLFVGPRRRREGVGDAGTTPVDDCWVLPVLRRRTVDCGVPGGARPSPEADQEFNATGLDRNELGMFRGRPDRPVAATTVGVLLALNGCASRSVERRH